MGMRESIGGSRREARQWQARHRQYHSCTRSRRQCQGCRRMFKEEEQLQDKFVLVMEDGINLSPVCRKFLSPRNANMLSTSPHTSRATKIPLLPLDPTIPEYPSVLSSQSLCGSHTPSTPLRPPSSPLSSSSFSPSYQH